MKRNASTEIPSNVIVVDTESNIEETDGIQKQTFRLGYAIRITRKGSEWTTKGCKLQSIERFWKLLDDCAREKTRLYVYAHNMKYDFAILKLDSYISSRKLDIIMDVRESVFIVKASNILFLSSTNYYQMSLKKLGKEFGLSKMETPNFVTVSSTELMTYCKRDTEVLATLIIKHIQFIKENDLGCFKPTIAGQALTAFRHRFMHSNLLIHNFMDILSLEQRSYRGGRCEAFRLGTFKDIYKLDINSMYPYVMKNFRYPTRPVTNRVLADCTLDMLTESYKSDKFVIADCDLKLNEPLIAVKREKLFFPTGRIRQVITEPEIRYLLNTPAIGSIEKIHSMVAYEQENIFDSYVDYFYKLKSESDNKAIVLMSKLFLNSLYGKFGQHCSTMSEKITDPIKIKMYFEIMKEENTLEIFDGISSKYIRKGDDLYHIVKVEGEYANNSIPGIASAVTAYSRTLLYDLIRVSGECLYCDTDSLFVGASGYEKLKSLGYLHEKEIGKLKVEEIGEVTINGAKDYIFNGKSKLKGIKSDATKISETEYRQLQFETGNARYLHGTPDGIVLVKPVIKTISRRYNKGIVNGSYITPLIFSDF